MAVDEEEKNRVLSPAEKKRLDNYEKISSDLTGQGYKRTELTIGIKTANTFAVIMGIPLAVIAIGLFFIINRNREWKGVSSTDLWILAVIFFVMIAVHELIHGVTWAIFTENHFKDIEFGFIKENFTPYCSCTRPLSRWEYILGAMMPLIILGIIPSIAGICIGSLKVLIFGIVMIISAGGDILLVVQILRYKSQAKEVLYVDHPTQAGGVVFERN